MVPGGPDQGQPGPAHGLGPERRAGRSGAGLLPEAVCGRQRPGHAQRDPPPGQGGGSFSFSFTSWLSQRRLGGFETINQEELLRVSRCPLRPSPFVMSQQDTDVQET